MPKILLLITCIISLRSISAQNLVINPGAEDLPRGTGWTIISSGTAACTFAPTDNFLNWTMVPDGTSNYPFDHTTGTAGGTVFYSGCSDFLGGPFELQQIVDVSADAAAIDLGAVNYTFGGYMQTPVSPQTDQGRFIVDYLNASNVVLGASYVSGWQSNLGGSGTGWVYYTNTRLAPASTRKVRIRLQTQLFLNRFAINVHFDDISLTKPVVLPVKIVSFTGNSAGNDIHLNWKVEDELNVAHYELEHSNEGAIFKLKGTIESGKTNYTFIDKNINNQAVNHFYRLKIVDYDGKFAYSKVLPIKTNEFSSIVLWPNPAKDFFTIRGAMRPGIINIIDANGRNMLTANIGVSPAKINISNLSAGVYTVRFSDGQQLAIKKMIVQTH